MFPLFDLSVVPAEPIPTAASPIALISQYSIILLSLPSAPEAVEKKITPAPVDGHLPVIVAY